MQFYNENTVDKAIVSSDGKCRSNISVGLRRPDMKNLSNCATFTRFAKREQIFIYGITLCMPFNAKYVHIFE